MAVFDYLCGAIYVNLPRAMNWWVAWLLVDNLISSSLVLPLPINFLLQTRFKFRDLSLHLYALYNSEGVLLHHGLIVAQSLFEYWVNSVRLAHCVQAWSWEYVIMLTLQCWLQLVIPLGYHSSDSPCCSIYYFEAWAYLFSQLLTGLICVAHLLRYSFGDGSIIDSLATIDFGTYEKKHSLVLMRI